MWLCVGFGDFLFILVDFGCGMVVMVCVLVLVLVLVVLLKDVEVLLCGELVFDLVVDECIFCIVVSDNVIVLLGLLLVEVVWWLVGLDVCMVFYVLDF